MKGDRPLVKVCGVTRTRDLELLAELGADLAGFIFHPNSPRFVGPFFPETAETHGLTKVGVFVRQPAESVNEIMATCGLDMAQLHGGQGPEFCRSVGPERVIKVLWPEKYDSLEAFEEELHRFASACRYFLFDAGTGGGGHGRTIAADYLNRADIPGDWFLAGGLSPENVAEVCSTMRPHGIDLNSGVESRPGVKDEEKLRKLFDILAGLSA